MYWLFNHDFYNWGENPENQDKTKKEENNHKSRAPKLKMISLTEKKKKKTPTPKWLNHAFMCHWKYWVFFKFLLTYGRFTMLWEFQVHSIPCVLIPTENQTLDDRILSEVHHHFPLRLHYGCLQVAEQSIWGPGNHVSDADSSRSFHH